MALYDVVNGVYRKVAKKYDPVGGVYRNVKAAYDPVDGVYRQYFSSSKPIPASELAVGDSVWLNVDGVLTEFLVIHQGNPSSAIYDASCNGTWLLMKDLYTTMKFALTSYDASELHTYLNKTFLELLDSSVKSKIKQVKIPYSTYYGANGLSTKIFTPSVRELGSTSDVPYANEGVRLSYFISGDTTTANGKRIARYKGSSTNWWTRSRNPKLTSLYIYVNADGEVLSSASPSYTEYGVRPAFIINSNTQIDEETHTIIE